MAPFRMFMQRIKKGEDRPSRLHLPRGQGAVRQERGLKDRADHEIRTIPIPLEVVKLLRAHIKRYGTTLEGVCQLLESVGGGLR
jgi:hypothetical protein